MTTNSTDKPIVVLIDDNPKILEIYSILFGEDHCLEVLTAKNKEEAIICVQNLTRPAVVILDRVFCDSKGNVVLGENLLPVLRQQSRFLIVTIFHSGDDSKEAKLLAMKSGAYWFSPKGEDIEVLVAIMWLAVDIVRQLTEPHKDLLTQALNRMGMFERVTSELSRAERLGSTTACLFFDLDNLKPINDLYGHPTGDNAITCVANCVRDRLRPTDVICRYGGDEIVVFLFDIPVQKGEEWVKNFAKSICDSVASTKIPVVGDTTKYMNISTSVGVAVLDSIDIKLAMENEGRQLLTVPTEKLDRSGVYTKLARDLIFSADKEMYKEKERRKS